MEQPTNKRSSNFTLKEETLLIECVKQFAKQIECKKSDTNANQVKSEAWIKVHALYNSRSGGQFRDMKGLRNKYENLKKRSKKRYSDLKQHRYGTGGGPPMDDPKLSVIDNEIQTIISTQMTGTTSKFDGDSDELGTPQELVEEEGLNNGAANNSYMDDTIVFNPDDVPDPDNADESFDVPSTSGVQTKPSHSKDWSSYTPAKLRQQKSEPLRITAVNTGKVPERLYGQNLKRKLHDWASAKDSLVEKQKEYLLEEHTLKLKLMRDKHEAQQKREAELHYKLLQLMDVECQLKLKKIQRNFLD